MNFFFLISFPLFFKKFQELLIYIECQIRKKIFLFNSNRINNANIVHFLLPRSINDASIVLRDTRQINRTYQLG